MLPSHFCWTRFGTEAGEGIGSILARKEKERLNTGGMFLWGIGNSVAPAIRDLINLERRPMAVFSPMRSKPKQIDVAPSGLLQWTYAEDLDGREWHIPEGINVTSRQGSASGREKRSHFALVCKSNMPLTVREEGDLAYESLVNLQSLNKLGASQVTAVVKRMDQGQSNATIYPVAFSAELVYPFFVKLGDPMTSSSGRNTHRSTVYYGFQSPLIA